MQQWSKVKPDITSDQTWGEEKIKNKKKQHRRKPNDAVAGHLTVQPHGTKDTRPNVTSEKWTTNPHASRAIGGTHNTARFPFDRNISAEKLWRAPDLSLEMASSQGNERMAAGSQVIGPSPHKHAAGCEL